MAFIFLPKINKKLQRSYFLLKNLIKFLNFFYFSSLKYVLGGKKWIIKKD